MNLIDIAFIISAVLIIVISARRGLVVSLLSTLKVIAGIPISYFISSKLYQQLYDNYVRDIVYNNILKKLSDSGADDFANGIGASGILSDYLAENIDTANLSGLTAEQISSSITDNILKPVILILIKIIIFIAVFVIICIIVSILISFFKKLQKKKHMPLKHTNSFFGGVLGLVKAAALIFTAATIIGYVCDIIPQDSSFSRLADGSFALEYINTNNPLLK